MRKLFYFFLLLIISISGYSQVWEISEQFECNDDLRVLDVKKDLNDNLFVTGIFKGTFNGNDSEGIYDIFLLKVDPSFNIDWIKTIGGASVEFDPRITISSDNNIFIVGAFKDSCIFDDTYLKSDGDFDIFLAKYSSVGNLLWTKNIANYETSQNPTDIDIDNYSNLIITGHYRDSINVDGEKLVNSGRNNFYAKFDTTGTKIWVKNISGTSNFSRLANVKVYQDEYYFNGYFRDELNFDIKTINSNVAGKQDLFLYKTDIDGNGDWLRRSYGDNLDFTGTITGDDYGNVYFTGYYQSSNMTIDLNEVTLSDNVISNNGSQDIFIFKYNKTGTLQWSKNFGDIGTESGVDLNVNGNVLYMSGYYSDAIDFGDQTLTSSGNADRDMFLASFDLKANAYNSISLGGTDGNDIAAGAIVLNSGDAIMAGYFQSSSITVGAATYVNTSPGLRDGVVAKYLAPFSVVFSDITEISCNSNTDGELIVTPEFGTPPYHYTWSNGAPDDSTATNLGAGTYTVTVTDANMDTDEVTYTLVEPDPITFNPAITQITQCSYTQEGAIDLNMAGGTGSFTYQWQESNGGYGTNLNAEDQSGLTIGTYTVSVSDANSCIADTTIILTGPDPVTFANSVVTDSSSLGAGEIDLEIQGGFGASFSYDWEYPSGATASTEDITNLNTGNYTVTVTDAHLCEFDTLFNVKNTDDFYVYITDFKDACKGTINGRAKVSYHSPDGHSNITYQWDSNAGDQTTAEATNLAPGRYYKVTVTDTDSDPDEVRVDSVYIDELSYDFTGSLSGTTMLNCFGDTDGYIDLSITSAGELPYSYSWSTGATLQDVTNLGLGTYNVTVTDNNQCTFTITNYDISQPTALAVSAEIVNEPSCNGDFDGEVTVDRTGGTSPYTYQWDDPGFQNTRNADGLDAGYYTVTVSDNNGCESTSGVELTEPDEISVTKLISNETCNTANDGYVSLTVSGGTSPFSYFWSTSNGSGLTVTDKDQSGLTAGMYYFTITDDNNCTYEDSVEITEPTLLEIIAENKTDIAACNGDNTGTITITATGGTGALTYTLNPGAIQTNATGSFTGLVAGTYTVYVEDENGCNVTSSSLEITQPDELVLTTDSELDAKCHGIDNGSITITVSGGTISSDYTYNWTTVDGSGIVLGSEDQLALGAGTYNLTVSDDNSCEVTSSYTLTEPDTISVSRTKYDLQCNGDNDGGVTLNVSGGVSPYTYNWTTTEGSGLVALDKNQTGLTAGKYYYSITDDNMCVYKDSVEIIEPTLLEITSEVATDVNTCNGDNTGSITITATGGTGSLTYTLNPGAIQTNATGSFTGLVAGTYTVYIEDENGCNVTSSSLEITQPDELVLTTDSELNAKCHGIDNGSISITVSGGTISSDYTYNWTTADGSGIASGSQDQLALGAGTYNLTVSDDNSCEVTSSYTLTEPDTISVSRTKYDLQCNGDNDGGVTLNVSGGVSPYSYEWSTLNGSGIVVPDKNQTGLTVGKYYYTIRDDNSCEYYDSVEIVEPIVLEIISEEAIDGSSCGGANTGEINVSASGGTGSLTYTLNPGAAQTNSTGNFTSIGTGNYTVQVEDENGCTINSSVLNVVEPQIMVITTDNQRNASCFGSDNGIIEITVTGGTVASDYTYAWSTTDGSGLIDGQQDQLAIGDGTYYLTVTDDNDCEVSSNYTITQPDSVVIEKSIYQPFCIGTEDGVVVLSITGGALPFSYFWSTTEGSGLVPTNKHQSNLSPGRYFIQLDDANGCIYYDSVDIIEPPIVTILTEASTDASGYNTRDGSVTITASGGTPPLTYTLNPGGELNYTGVFDDLNPGEYTVDVSDFNECDPISSNVLTVGSINSISEILLGEKVFIYPNPASSDLYIAFETGSGDDYILQFIDISGQVKFSKEFNSRSERKQLIDVSQFAKGLYFIRIYNNKGSYQEKILIQ